MRTWIIGDGNAARWHLAVRGEPAYAGHKNLRTRCTGKALYSTWGVSTQECDRPKEIEHAVCKRCDAMLARIVSDAALAIVNAHRAAKESA